MPREEKPEGKQELVPGPKEPHLGLVFADNTMMPIPQGARINLIKEVNKDGSVELDNIVPLALVSVSHRRMEMKCPCGNPACTRRVTWTAKWDGWHPPSQRK